MAFRAIAGLEYAALCTRPAFIPKGRPRGAKAAGLRYERAVAKAIPKALAGQWFEFRDANGPGHCQTDLLIVGSKRVVVIECKLSNVAEGQAQIKDLYFPVVQMCWPEKKPLGLVAARHLTRLHDESLVEISLEAAILRAEREGIVPVLHWLERTPL